MTILLSKIWFCLLIAFLIGLLIGWLWKHMCCKQKLEQLQSKHAGELNNVRQQENSQMQALLAEMDELKQRYQNSSGTIINAAVATTAISYSESDNKVTPKAPDLYSEAPQQRDDLKQIVGIGPVFEGMLNDLGIYQFEQLAALDEDNVHWIAEHIDLFPDRIYSDKWVEQAAELARNKQK